MNYVGAHINKESGSILKTIQKVQNNNGNALQIFVSNPRSIQLPNIQTYSNISKEVYTYCNENNFKLVVHASYTINLATDPKQGKKVCDLKDCYWINLLLNQLYVSNILGSIGVVVHVGKNKDKIQGLKNQYIAVKYIISQLQQNEIASKLIIETPAGVGNELLNTIEEFLLFYNMFSVEEKKYLGICFDTAHVWSAGYDINEYYKTMAKENANDIVVIHYNNSKKEQGSNVDVHDTIFQGKIPLDMLQYFIRNLQHNPLIILETPSTKFQKEIDWVKHNLYKD